MNINKMDSLYYTNYGYPYNQPNYYEEPEFIQPSYSEDTQARVVLPRNRKAWTMDTDDIHGPFDSGSSIWSSKKAGTAYDPYTVFTKRQTFPARNKEYLTPEEKVYMNMDVRDIMNWEYTYPSLSMSQNIPIWDRTEQDLQSPYVIKPIKHLNSIAGTYMEEPINRMDFRDKRTYRDGMEKFFSTPNVSIRPDNQDKLVNKFNLERVCKFVGEETGIEPPEFQPQQQSFFFEGNGKKELEIVQSKNYNNPQSLEPYDYQGYNNNINQQKVHLSKQKTSQPRIQKQNQMNENYQNQESYNVSLSLPRVNLSSDVAKQPACEIPANQECFHTYPLLKSKLANELQNNMHIKPGFEEVQVSDFQMTPATTMKYNLETRELTSYLKSNDQLLPEAELPFYLTANQKDVRPFFKNYCDGGMSLCIRDDALAQTSLTHRRNPQVSDNLFMKYQDKIFRNTFSDYGVQAYQKEEYQPKLKDSHLKPVNDNNVFGIMFSENTNTMNNKQNVNLTHKTVSNVSNKNMFLADITEDVKKRDVKERNTNQLKYQIRTTNQQEKPIRLSVKAR